MRVARQNREELSVAAELRQQQTCPFCAETFHQLAGLFLPKQLGLLRVNYRV